MRYLTILILFFLSSNTYAGIGHINKTFNDASRNRNIETEIYYPAASNGDNIPVSPGQYPLLVWGHGFVMNVNAYMNVVNALVNDGYIVALPKTEGGITPNHLEFAKDLLFLVNHLTENENALTTSLLYQTLTGVAAIGGHSMGGGCSILAGQLAAGNVHVKTIVNFAAANTNPSAITAAAGVTFPTLMFAGSNDCITTIADHQQPIFNELSAACKVLVKISGASHCYFADSSFTCSLGELTCNPPASITRSQQHTRTFAIMKPWLDIYLKGAGESTVNTIKQTWNNTSNYTTINQCSTLSVYQINQAQPSVSQFHTNNYSIHYPEVFSYRVFNMNGQLMMSGFEKNHSTVVDLNCFAAGTYLLQIISSSDAFAFKVIRN